MGLGPLALSEAGAGVQPLLTSEAPTCGAGDQGMRANGDRKAG